MIEFKHSYLGLGPNFSREVLPSSASKPELLLWNDRLADLLSIQPPLIDNDELKAQVFSGNQVCESSHPIALAYCGHQFGSLNPQLGDGRAHLLGEVDTELGLLDIQLKGSGQTPFSRNGDGRCALKPALREYLMSEAMFFLGVPTTQSLAVVGTGDQVYRESIKPGAVVTRIAKSHIRVGTFQYFSIHKQYDDLQKLLDYAIERHYPEAANADNRALAFLDAVMHKQIELVVQWMRVGFIHGVMNTDNMAISGDTIDFGPCAMMGVFDPATVYSSIDTQGRYAFGNQPNIALWNLVRLAESLLPIMTASNLEDESKESKESNETKENKAVSMAESVLKTYHSRFEKAFQTMMAAKLGLSITDENWGKLNNPLQKLVQGLMTLMQEHQLDYTETFTNLSKVLTGEPVDNVFAKRLNAEGLLDLTAWTQLWLSMLSQSESLTAAADIMQASNPLVIPRNHMVEQVLEGAEANGDLSSLKEMLKILQKPYTHSKGIEHFQALPEDMDIHYQTFCGT